MAESTMTVLLALDETEPAEFILESAAKTLESFRAYDLHLLTVVEPAVFSGDSLDQAAALDAARDRLHETATKLMSGRQIKARHIVSHARAGGAAHQIIQCAADLEADMIFIGTHGRTGVSRLVVGSVAEKVVREAACPVMVFRALRPAQVMSKSEPAIEPPCPRCVEVRKASGGAQLWCEQHSEVQERRHTYYQRDRIGESERPLGKSALRL